MEEILQYLQQCDIKRCDALEAQTDYVPGRDYPLIIVPGENIVEVLEDALETDEQLSLSEYVAQQSEKAAKMNIAEAFLLKISEEMNFADKSIESLAGAKTEAIFEAYASIWDGDPMLGTEQASSDNEPLELTAEWFEERMEESYLLALKLPEEKPFEAPLWIPMGGYNECPLPVIQSAIFKHFDERIGITPIVVTDSTWVILAKRRPVSFEEALLLAKEHFLFCPYVLEQHDTLGHYADHLLRTDSWLFWWD